MLHIPETTTAENSAVIASAPDKALPTDIRTLIGLHRYANNCINAAKSDDEMEPHNIEMHMLYRALIAATPNSVQEEAERLSYILDFLKVFCDTDGQIDGGWLDVPELSHIAKNLARLSAPAGPDALKVISKNIQPMSKHPEPRLVAELDRLESENDAEGLIALYDYFAALANANTAFANVPRASAVGDFLDADNSRLWSKAFAVADRLKKLKPGLRYRAAHARTLIDAAFAMGGTLQEVAAIARHLSEERE